MLRNDVSEPAPRPSAQTFKADLAEQTLDSQQCAALGLPPGTMWFDPSSKAQNHLIREQLKNSEFKDIRDMTNAENVVMRPSLPANTAKEASLQPTITVPDLEEAVRWARMHGFAEEEAKVLRSIFKLTSTIKPQGWLTGIEFGKAIGKGAFGSIHKAVYNGQDVAVKRVTPVCSHHCIPCCPWPHTHPPRGRTPTSSTAERCSTPATCSRPSATSTSSSTSSSASTTPTSSPSRA